MMASENLRSQRELLDGPRADDFELDAHSDSEDSLSGAPDLLGVKDSDRSVLETHAEQEKLLTKPSRFGAARLAFTGDGDSGTNARRQNGKSRNIRRAARRRRQSKNEQDAELMFEMESGFKDNSSEEDVFVRKQTKSTSEERPNKRAFCRRIAVLHVLVVILFVALILGAYHVSRKTTQPWAISTLSNGTHLFRPTTILLSLDGFRADFLNRDITPTLSAFIASGVSPRYMLPSFPSVTFPNHFTLVTGLYPSSHGVVGNTFWDPALQEEFYYTHTKVSMQPRWWTAEPLWVTAQHQGVRTAIHMWPGSEAHIPDVEPAYLDRFNGSEELTNKANRILTWLDLPGDDDEVASEQLRPQLILAYVPNVDVDGHKYGPNSTEIRGTIADVDGMLSLLVEGLFARNLTEVVNIVCVSDHGMATTDVSRLIQLDDLIDLELVDHIDGWPLRGLRLKNPDRDVPILYEQLASAAEEMGTFDVYTLDTMPERWHFTGNDRIAPLWVIPKTGWAVVERADFDVAEALTTGRQYSPIGLHGYDHEHPLMSAIFVARGPAFPHAPNSRVPVFQNIEVYNIVADSLGITPHPNNGTLRLPLQTDGLHSDPEAAVLDTPTDPPESKTSMQGAGIVTSATKPALGVETDQTETASDQDTPPPEGAPTPWWQFLHDQIEKAKDWAKQLVDSIKSNKHGTEHG